MAYKGGHFERDFLEEQRLPYVNSESFAHPKPENFFDALVQLETCDNHIEQNAYHHWSKVEVDMFWQWLAEQHYARKYLFF